MTKVILPSFTIGIDAFNQLTDLGKCYGNRIVILYGEKAYQACSSKLLDALNRSNINIINSHLYGNDATYEHVNKLKELLNCSEFDWILAVGGGKCLDTAKVVADQCKVPVVTVPTIASTCAAITKISVMYTANGQFKDIYTCQYIPVHCLMDSELLMQAPIQYLWAGMGDTLAKSVETRFSSRNDELTYNDALALEIGNLCFDSILEHGIKAYEDCKKGCNSQAFEITIQNIIISTGMVSILINPAYNSALAHALFYGLTCRKEVEEHHLHGEIVAYGVLVQLCLDQQETALKRAMKFYKGIQLPNKLRHFGLSVTDNLDDILELTCNNKELDHVPYRINKQMIFEAITTLENIESEQFTS